MDTDELDLRLLMALERIADALEVRAKTDERGMEMASSFTDFIKLVIQNEGRPLHQVDVPPTDEKELFDGLTPVAPLTDGDMLGINAEMAYGEPGDMPAMGTENYDPDDPPSVLVGEASVAIVCPNCGWSRGHPVVDHGGPVGIYQCSDCGHCFNPEDVEEHAREGGR